MLEIKNKYADERRTSIDMTAIDYIEDESLIPVENSIVALTKNGYIKRMSVDNYKTQNRGGVGIKGMSTNDEDFVEKSGIDIGCALEHYRDDFISLGYADSFIKLANSSIKLVHKPNFGDCTNLDLAIGGHLHKYKFSCGDGTVKIVCPALSNVNPYRNFAGALMLKLNFDSSNLADLVLSQLMVIDGKVVETGENYYQYTKKRK